MGSIAPTIHALLDILVGRLINHCRSQESASTATQSMSASLATTTGMGGVVEEEEYESPADIVRVDERHIGEYASNYLFGHLHSRLFPPETTRADLRTAENISGLAWLKPRHL